MWPLGWPFEDFNYLSFRGMAGRQSVSSFVSGTADYRNIHVSQGYG